MQGVEIRLVVKKSSRRSRRRNGLIKQASTTTKSMMRKEKKKKEKWWCDPAEKGMNDADGPVPSSTGMDMNMIVLGVPPFLPVLILVVFCL